MKKLSAALACIAAMSAPATALADTYYSPTVMTQSSGANLQGVWYKSKAQACVGPWLEIFGYFTPSQITSRQDNQPCGLNNGVTLTVVEAKSPPTVPHTPH